MAPTIEELAKDLAGKVLVAKLDVDENPQTAEKFQVYSIPTVVLIKDCCEVDRIVGLCPRKQYDSALAETYAKVEACFTAGFSFFHAFYRVSSEC